MKGKIPCFCIFFFLCASCHNYKDLNKQYPVRFFNTPFTNQYQASRLQNFILPEETVISFAIENFSIKNQKEQSSFFQDLFQIEKKVLSQFFPKIISQERILTLEEALSTAKAGNAQFLFYTSTQQFKNSKLVSGVFCHFSSKQSSKTQNEEQEKPNKNLEKNSKSDCKLELKNPQEKSDVIIWIFDVASGNVMDRIEIRARSGLINSWQNNSVHLLETPLKKIIRTYRSHT